MIELIYDVNVLISVLLVRVLRKDQVLTVAILMSTSVMLCILVL